MGLKKYLLVFIVFITNILITLDSFCYWDGPVEVINASWGDTENQFGKNWDYMEYIIPTITVVTPRDNIYLNDTVNNRICIYNLDGVLSKIITYKKTYPNNKKEINPEYERYNFWGLKDYTSRRNIWISKNKKYILKSPDGNIIKEMTIIPDDLGRVKQKQVTKDQYKSIITYPDRTYQIDEYINNYIRDIFSNLLIVKTYKDSIIGIGDYRVIRYDVCEEDIIFFDLPKSVYYPPDNNALNDIPDRPIIEYRKPVISYLGNIYCVKYSEEAFIVLKWTWQGEASAPQSLKTKSNDNKIDLSWELPTEDQKIVTAYEVSRSTEVCGPYEPIKEVDKNSLTYIDKDVQVGDTYYYQVRAIRDGQYSGYSNKAIGIVE